MSVLKTTEKLNEHKNSMITHLSDYIDGFIKSNNPRLNSKADKLCYWMDDYIKFLEFEERFNPSSLKRYKRGEVIKVHLGYNIGSEEGGLHYAVVLDNNNSIHSPVVTIAPLTSLKKGVDINRLRKGALYIGNELYTNLLSKISIQKAKTDNELASLEQAVSTLNTNDIARDPHIADELRSRIVAVKASARFITQMKNEILKMKVGSIVLTNQITTISKIRIYDPKTNNDILGGIRLTDEKLDMIDNEIRSCYLKPIK